MWSCSSPPSRRGGSPVSASSSVAATGSEAFVSHVFLSDSLVEMLKRYNADYTGSDSDLPRYRSLLIRAPDQSSTIFHFFRRREGYRAQPQESSAPQRVEEASLTGNQ